MIRENVRDDIAEERSCRPPAGSCERRTLKIAVVGVGAMGSVYAALLGSAGNEVWAVDPWEAHVAAIRERGLRVEGASGDRTVRIDATTARTEVGPVDLVVVSTKAGDVRDAALAACALLGPETVVLPIQNGLGSTDVVAGIVGDDRVVIGVAGGFGASIVAPGHAHHEGMELVRLGERRGPASARLERVAEVWRAAGFTVRTDDDVRCARLGEARLQRLFQRNLRPARRHDRGGARRSRRVGGRHGVRHRGNRSRPRARNRALLRRPGRSRARVRRCDPRAPGRRSCSI